MRRCRHDPAGDLLDGVPVLSAARLAPRLSLARAPASRPTTSRRAPGDPTLLLVRRDPAGVVRFSELSALAFLLLQRIGDNDWRRPRTSAQSRDGSGRPDLAAFEREGAAMLQRLRDDDVLLGQPHNAGPRC